jgi:hypothetical protein
MQTSNIMRRDHRAVCAGKEIFEIQPILFGGNSTETSNKVLLNRNEHIEAVNYWNNMIRVIRKNIGQ